MQWKQILKRTIIFDGYNYCTNFLMQPWGHCPFRKGHCPSVIAKPPPEALASPQAGQAPCPRLPRGQLPQAQECTGATHAVGSQATRLPMQPHSPATPLSSGKHRAKSLHRHDCSSHQVHTNGDEAPTF